jgi:GMP synthase-like glutamine amidotransferase
MSPAAERRPILVLQHAGCEPPAAYEDELVAQKIAFQRIRLDQGEELPDWHAYAGILAMGGAMGVNDDAVYPWLAGEKRLIGEAVRAGLPYWGVCLGAQLLAASLGARVAPGPRPELGWGAVELTAGADSDPVFAGAPASFATLHWHGDTYELPAGAVQLARSQLYQQQAFVLGRAYALQFHLEVDSALAGEWMRTPAFAEELRELEGADAAAALLAQMRSDERESLALARELFSRWLRLLEQPGG